MLIEVCVRRVLQAPTLIAKLDRDDAEILTCRVRTARSACAASRIALVFDAKLTCGVLLAIVLGSSRGSNLARIFLGFREVDRDFEVAPAGGRGPLDIARDGRAAYVSRVAAKAIEPIGGCLRALFGCETLEFGSDLAGLWHEDAHYAAGDAVASAGSVVGDSVFYRLLCDGRKGIVEVEISIRKGAAVAENPRRVRGRPCGTDALKNDVVRPCAIVFKLQAMDHRVIDERLNRIAKNGCVNYSHVAYAPSSETL